jgi:hypothetical protein
MVRDLQKLAMLAVLFDEDICAELRISLRQLMRLRRAGAFPIPELPSLDKRHRYARRDVDAFLSRETRAQSWNRRAG